MTAGRVESVDQGWIIKEGGLRVNGILVWLIARLTAVARVVGRGRLGYDRGDVPGWVLVAVMTAGLVTALWVVADGQLSAVLDRAINSVSK